MKVGLAIRELHRAERSLTRELLRLADQHQVEHEIHYTARDLAGWAGNHVSELAAAGRDHGLRLSDHPWSMRTPRLAKFARSSRRRISRWLGRRPETGLVLLADLRHLHHTAAGVSLDWELLAQGAQAVKDPDLLELAQRCHPQTLRQLKWSNAMLKILSPQVLAS